MNVCAIHNWPRGATINAAVVRLFNDRSESFPAPFLVELTFPWGRVGVRTHDSMDRFHHVTVSVVRLALKMKDTKDDDGARSCAVCLESILPSGEAFLTTVCKHHFHFRCIRPWVGRGPCPSCRCADWLGEPPPGGDVPLPAPDAVLHATEAEPDVAFVPAVERFHVDGRLAGPNILNQVFPAPRYNADVPLRRLVVYPFVRIASMWETQVWFFFRAHSSVPLSIGLSPNDRPTAVRFVRQPHIALRCFSAVRNSITTTKNRQLGRL